MQRILATGKFVFLLAPLLLAPPLLVSGCAEQPAAAPGGVAVAIAPQQEPETGPEKESGIRDKMSGLLNKTREMLGDAGDATGQTADDTMDWINETYQALSERGMTSARDAQEWVAEDWNAINAWEYKVVKIAGNDPTELEKKLNELGKQRWDCFHVSETATGITFFAKRQKKSFLKNIPLKDMLKLIPLLDGDGEP